MKNIKVFVSTGYYKNISPIKILKYLIKKKINDIEFSGGLPMSLNEEKEFFKKLKKHNIRLHNYFPPPKEKFVINLASSNRNILKRSIAHVKKSILYSKKINAKYFSFHAGFRIDPGIKRLGKKFEKVKMENKNKSESIFLRSVENINRFALRNKVKILIENNVINKKNLSLFSGNPLLLTHPTDILNFFKKAPRNIGFLLDVGHLKVSSKTENFNLIQSLKRLNKIVSGYHLSENNFFEDQNAGFSKNTWFVKLLKKDLDYYTIEVYDNNIGKIKKIKSFLEKSLN